MDRIGGELNNQYILGYRLSEGDRPGYHSLRVLVNRSKTTVRTRPGYYLMPAP